MKIDLKPRTIVVVVLVQVILVGGFFYIKKTKPKRAYMKELKTLRIVEEHQRLEIAVVKQRATLQAINKAPKAGTPTFNMAPEEPEAKRQANQ